MIRAARSQRGNDDYYSSSCSTRATCDAACATVTTSASNGALSSCSCLPPTYATRMCMLSCRDATRWHVHCGYNNLGICLQCFDTVGWASEEHRSFVLRPLAVWWPVHETTMFFLATLPDIHRFKKIFTDRLSNKPFLIWLLTIPPHLNCVAALPCNLPLISCFLTLMFHVVVWQHVPSVLWRCWLGGRKGIRPVKKLSGGVLAWLSVWSEVQTCIWPSCCHCHSLSLASVKSRLVLPFWYRLTRVVPEKGPLNGMCVYVCVWQHVQGVVGFFLCRHFALLCFAYSFNLCSI